MRRLRPVKLDTPEWYTPVWTEQPEHYDTLRMEALVAPLFDSKEAVPRVLDVGCGPYGSGRWALEKRGRMAHVYGLDFAPVVPKLGGYNVRYITANVEPVLAIRDGVFDVVMAGEVIEHTEDPAAFARELVRVCRVGGRITLSTVDTRCGDAIRHGPYPEHLWEFDPGDLVGFFADMADVTYKLVGDYHCLDMVKRSREGPAL